MAYVMDIDDDDEREIVSSGPFFSLLHLRWESCAVSMG